MLSSAKLASQNRSDHGGRERARNHSAAEIAALFAWPAAKFNNRNRSDFWGYPQSRRKLAQVVNHGRKSPQPRDFAAATTTGHQANVPHPDWGSARLSDQWNLAISCVPPKAPLNVPLGLDVPPDVRHITSLPPLQIVRKSLMSATYPPAILGPEMAAAPFFMGT